MNSVDTRPLRFRWLPLVRRDLHGSFCAAPNADSTIFNPLVLCRSVETM
jgi:hypothetical protein